MTAEIKKRRFAEGVIVTNPTDLNVGGGGSGSGGVNLNINPNASLALDNGGTNDVGDWLDSGAGTTLSRETTTFPLGDTVTSAIKISFSAGTGDYSYIRFRVPESARNTRLGFFQYMLATGYTAGTCKMEIYSYSDAYVTGEAEVALSTDDSSGDTLLPNITGQFRFAFDADDREYYEIRYINEGATSGSITLNEVTVTPSLNVVSSSFNGIWKEYDETYSLVTGTNSWANVEVSLMPYKDKAGNWYLKYNIIGNTSTVSSLEVTIPGITFKNTAASRHWPIYVTTNSANTANVATGYATEDSNVIAIASSGNRGTWQFGGDTPLESKPTWADFDPTDNYYNGSSDPEYASNSDTTDSNASEATTTYGTSGQLIPNRTVGTEVRKSIVFQTPLQPSDTPPELEVNDGNGWLKIESRLGVYVSQGSSLYGAKVAIQSDGSVDVTFSAQGYAPNNASYAGNGAPWSGLYSSAWRWRLVKSRAGSISGFGHATATQSGLVSAEETFTSTLDSGFSAGTLRGTRVGKQVTLSVDNDFVLASAATSHLSSALIPVSMRPLDDVATVAILRSTATTRMSYLIITAAGQVKLEHVNSSLSAVSTNGTDMSARGFTVSYSIAQ